MIRLCLILTALALVGCAADPHALTYVRSDDPMWRLNPDLWDQNTNALTSAPTLSIGRAP